MKLEMEKLNNKRIPPLMDPFVGTTHFTISFLPISNPISFRSPSQIFCFLFFGISILVCGFFVFDLFIYGFWMFCLLSQQDSILSSNFPSQEKYIYIYYERGVYILFMGFDLCILFMYKYA